MRKIALILILLLTSIITPIAQEEITTYQSEDAAITFDYHSEWTIEQQNIAFGESYVFELWTPEPNPFVPIDRSRILLEVLNRNENNLSDLETPLDFAENSLNGMATFDSIDEEVGLLDSPSVRVEFVGGNDFPVVLYSIVLSDDWVILASVWASEEEIEIREEALIFILESIELDEDAASTPFVRDLETYDTDNIVLDETYESDDLNLTFSYPEDWELLDDDETSTFTVDFAYYVDFEVSDVQVQIQIVDVTEPALNAPRDSDTPNEYMQLLRQSDEGEVTEFLIGDNEAVSIINQDGNTVEQFIIYALNDRWIAAADINAESEDDRQRVETSVVAVLGSIEFAQGASYIRFPVLTVELPEPWQLGLSDFQNGEQYNFILRPSDNPSSNESRILIQIVNLEAVGLDDLVEDDDLDGIFETLHPDGEDAFSEMEIEEYRTYQSDIFQNERDAYGQYTVILLDDMWLFIAYAASFDEDEIESIQDDINTIIETMTITLPEQ